MIPPAPPRFDPLRAAADAYLDSCFAQQSPPHVSELANLVGLSLPAFSAAFLDECGERPSAYLKRAQLERARTLLESTGLSVYEIARSAAFGTEVTFFRAFRRAFGRTPAEHRRAVSK